MFKRYSTFIILFFVAFATQAQVETSIGFKGGFNTTNFSGKALSNQSWGYGPEIGGFVNLGLADMAQFQFEMIYNRMKAEYSADEKAYKANAGYLNIPLLFKLRIPVKESIYPFVSIGQSVGYQIGDDSRQYVTVDRNTTQSADGLYKNFNVSTIVDLGVDFESEYVFFTAGIRYSRGNIDISKADYSITPNSLALTAGMGFKLVKR
jgi:hypothetical protein